ncbi:MAG: NAD(P)-dependent oxidoreductase [Deltaproteobacteria bacterium]|nr:NAD(P)-dependent oxidoreductase [Deltaproteobacteria bacterium]
MGQIVLITGAAGLIGSHLCEAFAAAGHTVRAVELPGIECPEALAAGATVHAAQLDRPEGALALAELAKGASLLVHAAFPAVDDARVAVELVRASCAAAVSAQAPLLLLSSCAVYGRPRNLPCDEGELKEPVDAQGLARWAAEHEAWLWRRTKGMKLVVLRPALSYGPRSRRGLGTALHVAALAAHFGRSLLVPRRGPVVHAVHAVDVARAALLVADSGIAAHDGRAFNVADDVPLPLEELSRALLQAVGAHEIGRLPWSRLTTQLVLWLLRKLPRWMVWGPLNRRLAQRWLDAFAGQPPMAPPQIGPDLLEQLAADRYYDTQRLRALGYAPSVPSVIEGLRALAADSRAKKLLPAPHPTE